jgi:quercetin dioxygenase-like cupin family protein
MAMARGAAMLKVKQRAVREHHEAPPVGDAMLQPDRQSVSRRGFLTAMAATTVAAGAFVQGISPSISAAAGGPARLSTSFESWFEVIDRPGAPFEIVQRVVEFPIGSRAARHVNGGPAYLTVLGGELTMWIGDAPARAYPVGESFVEPFRTAAEAANLGATEATVLVTYLIPVGSAVSMLEGASTLPADQRPPGPTLRFESRLRIDEELPYSQVGQVLQTYEPGAWTVAAEAPTARLLSVVSGEVTVLTGATQQTYSAGQHWIERPGQAWLSGNSGSSPAVVAVSTTRSATASASAQGPGSPTTDSPPTDALAARLMRTEVQRGGSSIPGREIVQVLTEIPAGVESGWHIHPGEEVGYIIAGTVEMRVRGEPTRTLRAGDGFLIPPRTAHNAFDVGPETGRMLSTYIVEAGQPLATVTG